MTKERLGKLQSEAIEYGWASASATLDLIHALREAWAEIERLKHRLEEMYRDNYE